MISSRINPIISQVKLRFESKPPSEQYQLGIYWSVVVLSVLILSFSIYHVQAIPAKIGDNIKQILVKRPWVNDFVVVDGQDVFLSGVIEPDSRIEQELNLIDSVAGVQSITNMLNEEPKLSAHVDIEKSETELIITGQLSGEVLELIVDNVSKAFADIPLTDRIKIDDRLGRPLWLEGFDQSLNILADLEQFKFSGWRDQLQLSGLADNDRQRRQLGYSVPASLVSGIKVHNHIRLPVSKEFPDISIVSNWSGAMVSGTVPSELAKNTLTNAAQSLFGENGVEIELEVQESLLFESALINLSGLLPALSSVRDLQLQSTEKSFVIWGRVDEPQTLGLFLEARNKSGMEQVIKSRIRVSKGEKPATITLFSDSQQAIISGLLPSKKSQEQLFSDISQVLGISKITDLTIVEPNVIHSPWISNWSQLLQALPGDIIGITIDHENVLISGTASDQTELVQIDQTLKSLLPDLQHLNWVSIVN